MRMRSSAAHWAALGSMGRSMSYSSPILSLSRTDTVLWGGVSVPPMT